MPVLAWLPFWNFPRLDSSLDKDRLVGSSPSPVKNSGLLVPARC